jgi:hypothetical protein
MRDIALIGKIGSGKDTAAAGLIAGHGYSRVAFADPLKSMVVEADPIVQYEPSGCGPLPVHLSDVLRRMSFESAKRTYPEVRRALQRIGQGVRKIDPDYWVNLALKQIEIFRVFGLPVVVTDVRYPNEVKALAEQGFLTVRVISDRQDNSGTHESETALDEYHSDYTLLNNGSKAELFDVLGTLV